MPVTKVVNTGPRSRLEWHCLRLWPYRLGSNPVQVLPPVIFRHPTEQLG